MSKKIKESDIKNMPSGGAIIGKREGQTIIHEDGSMGGYLGGKLHKEGGIKAEVEATGQKVELQGGEIIINAVSCADTTKRPFEGEMLTNRQILSKINSESGGVSFADGGDIPNKIQTSGKKYNYGGEMMSDSEIVSKYASGEAVVNPGGTDDGPYTKETDEEALAYNEIFQENTIPGEAIVSIHNDASEFARGGEVNATYRDLLIIPKSEAIQIIKLSLKSDYFFELNDNGLKIVSESVYKIFLYCFEHNKTNPYISKFGDRVIFEPDKRLVEKEKTYLSALIKYAAHFFTGEFFVMRNGRQIRKRTLDVSKVDKFNLLVETIINPDKKLNATTKPNRVYYFKYVEDNNTLVCFNICVDDNVIIGDNIFFEAVTFMPDKSKIWLESQIASGKYNDLTDATELLLPQTLLKDDHVCANQDDTIDHTNISLDHTKIWDLFNKYKKKFLNGGEIYESNSYSTSYEPNLISDAAIIQVYNTPHDGNSEVYRGKKSFERGKFISCIKENDNIETSEKRKEIIGYDKFKEVEKNGGYIKTDETKIDNDYDSDDVDYKLTKAYKVKYEVKWHDQETNSNPDVETFDTIDQAYKDAQIEGDWWNGTQDHMKRVEPVYEEVWLNSNGVETEDGENRNGDEFLETKEGKDFIEQIFSNNKFDNSTIYSKDFGSRDDDSRELESTVYHNLGSDLETRFKADNGETYKIKHNGKGKYSRLSIIDKNGDEIDDVQLRIADHTYNPANNDDSAREGKFISVEIANENKTKNKFNTSYSLQFDGSDTYDDVLDKVKERLHEILETKIQFAKGGLINKKENKKIKIIDIPASLEHFIPSFQQKALIGSTEHWELLDRLEDIIKSMPVTYGTQNIKADEKIVYLHYFYGGSDWYIVEKDVNKDQQKAFGYAIINGDLQMAEWGYISIEELNATRKVELDFYFEPIKFGELKKKWTKGTIPQMSTENYRNIIRKNNKRKEDFLKTGKAKDAYDRYEKELSECKTEKEVDDKYNEIAKLDEHNDLPVNWQNDLADYADKKIQELNG